MSHTQAKHAFFPHFPPEVLEEVPSRVLAWTDRQRQRAALARLDARLLEDIGVTRDEAAAESRRRD